MSLRNRFGSFQNTPFKYFKTPRRPFFRNRTNDGNRGHIQQQHQQQQQQQQRMQLETGEATTYIGNFWDYWSDVDWFKNFNFVTIILSPFRYLTNFFWKLSLIKQMQYSLLLFILSFYIFYSNLPTSSSHSQSIPISQQRRGPHSLNNKKRNLNTSNNNNNNNRSSFSMFRLIILLISFITILISIFVFFSALLKYISNYFNGNDEELLLTHSTQAGGIQGIQNIHSTTNAGISNNNNDARRQASYLSEMPINMANSNRHHHQHSRQQRSSLYSTQNSSNNTRDMYYGSTRGRTTVTGDEYDRLLTVPEMRRMQQQRGIIGGGSSYHEQKEFEEHTGLGSHGRRNLQSLSPNRKLALDPHATVDRESMQRELHKDAIKLDLINQQFGRLSPTKIRGHHGTGIGAATSRFGDLNSNTTTGGAGGSGTLNSPQTSYSRSRSKTRSPRFTFMNFGDSARSSGIGGISGISGMSVVSGTGVSTTTGAGSRGSRGSRATHGITSVAETNLTIAKAMEEQMRQQRRHHHGHHHQQQQDATPIRRALSGMKFTPAPQLGLLETPMTNKYGHGHHHSHIPRSRTPTGTRSRLHVNNMNTIDENPVPMSIDRSLLSGIGASGGGGKSKDDSFVFNRRWIGPSNLRQSQAQSQMPFTSLTNNINNINNNSNNMNMQRAQYDAMLNDRGMYGNLNLRMNRINPNGPASLAVQQQRQQEQQRLQIQQQLQQGHTIISPTPFGTNGKYQSRLTMSPFSRQEELAKMKKHENHESRFLQKYGGSRHGSNKYSSSIQQRSDFVSEYLERSSKLYENLNIDEQIHHWSSNMRWWVSDRLKEKYQDWRQNNQQINQLFVRLNQWYPNCSQQFAQWSKTLQKKVEFVLGNEGKLNEVSREQHEPMVQTIVQTRKKIKQNADKIDRNTEYIFQRLTDFVQSSNLNVFQWNSGGTISREHGWRAELYPTDGELLMGIFCEYMDAIFCPAFEFSTKHFIAGVKQREIKELKYFGRYFKDIAIVQVLPNVTRRNPNDDDKHNRDNYTSFNRDRHKRERERDRRRQLLEASNNNNNYNDDTTGDLPYYFIIYDKEKFDENIKDFIQLNKENNTNNNINGIRKPKAYLDNNNNKGNKINDRRRNKVDSFENDYYGKKKRKFDNNRQRGGGTNGNNPVRKDYVSKVGAWYPIPGKDNVFHCLVLLAFFLQKFNRGELMGLKLKDQNCDLLRPLQR